LQHRVEDGDVHNVTARRHHKRPGEEGRTVGLCRAHDVVERRQRVYDNRACAVEIREGVFARHLKVKQRAIWVQLSGRGCWTRSRRRRRRWTEARKCATVVAGSACDTRDSARTHEILDSAQRSEAGQRRRKACASGATTRDGLRIYRWHGRRRTSGARHSDKKRAAKEDKKCAHFCRALKTLVRLKRCESVAGRDG